MKARGLLFLLLSWLSGFALLGARGVERKMNHSDWKVPTLRDSRKREASVVRTLRVHIRRSGRMLGGFVPGGGLLDFLGLEGLRLVARSGSLFAW